MRESQERERKQLQLVKWDIFRQKRDFVLMRFMDVKAKKHRVKQFKILMFLVSFITKFAKLYNETKIEQVTKAVQNFCIFKMQFRLKRYMKKKGPT